MVDIKKLVRVGLCAVMPLLLTSCYFNSAGKIFDNASHQACAFTQDIKPHTGQVVYKDGDNYYIELPRYRFDKPVTLQYNALLDEDEDADKKVLEKKGMAMYSIPENFALYLIGKRSSPKVPDYMVQLDDGSYYKKYGEQIPVVRKPGKYCECYTYKSPNAGWLYLGGVFDWLCVDLPVTCVENALVIAGSFAVMAGEAQKNANSYSGYSSGGGGGGGSNLEGWQYNSYGATSKPTYEQITQSR